MVKEQNLVQDESGQSILEYILLLAIVTSLVLLAMVGLDKIGLQQKLMSPIQEKFAQIYQYGHKDGEKHNPKDARRIFMSPVLK